jgi:hypothetical protein
MELRALKTFSSGGVKTISQGDTFSADKVRAEELIRLKLAESVNGEMKEAATVDTQIKPDEVKTDFTEEELLTKNLTELRKIAKTIGVNGVTGFTKSELIFAIRAQQNQ